MRMNPLGRSGLMVSELCLGTMTFGTQTPEQESHAQIDLALEGGINFVDTAEMYPVNPVKAETIGRTEEIIGAWLGKNANRRGDMILATKHSGEGLQSVRNGAPISSQTIPEAIEGSLRRLQTDYIDLYQFHWPNRGSYMFPKNWIFDPSSQRRLRISKTRLKRCKSRWTRGIFVILGCLMTVLGAQRNGSGFLKIAVGQESYPCRMNTLYCAASMIPIWRNSA